MQRRSFLSAIAGVTAAPLAGSAWSQRRPDVVYVPTPQEVVDVMLDAARVGAGDVLYDLGCGDGRVVVTAARRLGARGIGVDIDPERIKEAQANVERSGVSERVRIVQGDLFEFDFRDASVVTLYLLPSLNLKLRPKLWSELKPGARVVSHDFDMGDWMPERRIAVGSRTVYLWTIAAKSSAAVAPTA